MSVNDLTVNQASTILNSLVAQATGRADLVATNSGDFVSVAQTALKMGYEPILNSLSQMWGRTIFSVRPYSRKFKGVEMDGPRWGNAIRKVSIADKEITDDQRFLYPVKYDASESVPTGDGISVDMFKLNKPDVIQTNFYGQSVYQNDYTIFRDNLDTAFSGPDEFMRFNAMVAQNRSDKLEQYRENIARALIVNLAGSLIAENQDGRVIHVLTEYNTQLGLTGDDALTAETVYYPDNYKAFIQWLYARLADLSNVMTERSELFQTIINGKHVMRHTPANRQKIYLYSKFMTEIDAMVKSNTYHDNLLKMADYEAVTFWQSIKSRDAISVRPTYTNTSGEVVTEEDAIEADHLLGVIFDEEALGYAQVNAWNALTPFNTKGGYWNDTDHVNFRTLMDMTEKAVVLVLD